jgi:hypothetical protein
MEDQAGGCWPQEETMTETNEGKGTASSGGWLFLGVALGAAIVGCCWLMSLRAIREVPSAPPAPPPPAISCDCGTVTLVNPQDWSRVLFDAEGKVSDGDSVLVLERLP